ncbi:MULTISPECIES: hypothetical protein [Methylobacterium]|uniref:Uncharacterized protein n=2 Tax=Methylobacterium TaxID=407 RepID=A0A2R4WS12_9HYPH|nr:MULTISPECIES: hypothetical protein [Methylobacterium]AWB24315.1 hypothetical protein DA075_28430 [Methylobacterium currus]NGM33776.1 hypothetical protein [Methylobacterium sp. DB0501]
MTVDVYWNRRLRPRAWSVRDGGRVSRYVREITLMNVRFVVHPAAVARVQRLRQRAVCAYARGIPCEAPRYPSAIRVRFDPYDGPHFVTPDGFVVLKASLVHFLENGQCYAVL